MMCQPWCVVRTDDLGVEHVMSRGLSEGEATRLVEIMAVRGHKQFYQARPQEPRDLTD